MSFSPEYCSVFDWDRLFCTHLHVTTRRVCIYTKSIIYYYYLIICMLFDFPPSILTTYLCVSVFLQRDVTYSNSLCIIRPTTTTLVNRPRIGVYTYPAISLAQRRQKIDLCGIRHSPKGSDERMFGTRNENGAKRCVLLFSENIYIAKRFKEHAIVFVYFSSVFQFVQ